MLRLNSTASLCFSARFKNPLLSRSPSSSSSLALAAPSSSPYALRNPNVTPLEHLRYDSTAEKGGGSSRTKESKDASDQDDDMPPRKQEKRISGIHVPRQKYISVTKVDLLDAILSMFGSKQDAEEFKRLAMCLDSILHVEHKGILEEMRAYYSSTFSKKQCANYAGSSIEVEDDVSGRQHVSLEGSNSTGNRAANNCRNDDVDKLSYLNGLDLRKLFGHSPVDSVLESRRGYATERQKGLLIVEKLDYLQSKLLQEIFFSLSRPMKQIGRWLNEALKGSHELQNVQSWLEKVKVWLKEKYSPESVLSLGESMPSDQPESYQVVDRDLPVWLAAQKAVSRYEGLLSPVGPRGRLIRRLLVWIGIIPSLPEVSTNSDDDKVYSETYLRPNFLPRITPGNLWEPATRESCGYNIWKMLKTAVYILCSQSILQEPAFQELVLLYTEKSSQKENDDRTDINPLQLKIYEKIPIPDLPVIFPHKKLSFRILDTVRLDVASTLGLLAYFINYKFENIASSPSAVFLDVIAISALIIYVSRVVLGYKQTWDRYQLLVNRTLYEKTLASGFGSVHFLLDASEQQQFKEAILVYAILLHLETYELPCRKNVRDSCEKFIYDRFKEMIEMPVDKAVDTLMRLGLLSEIHVQGNIVLKVLPCSEAFQTLRRLWTDLLK